MRHRSLAALAAASFLLSSAARAATPDDNHSQGKGELRWQSRTPIQGPTSDPIGGSTLQAIVGADLDPLPDATKPLLRVDLTDTVVLEARWTDSTSIDLVVVDNADKEGIFKVEHTLAPHMKFLVNAFGSTLSYDYNATKLLQYVPGSAWSYHGFGETPVAPWTFDAAQVQVKAPALADAQLFSIPLEDLTDSALSGVLALNATTSPKFFYATNEVRLEGGKITAKGGSLRVPTTDADYLDIPANVTGEITYTGSLLARPSITITKIGKFTLPLALTLDVPAAGVDLPYSATARKGIPVVFPLTSFHIPLPNVKALESLDLGTVTVGESASKQGDVNNTGEMDASMTFKSSDPQFVVMSGKHVAKSKGKVALDVTFKPTKAGTQTADITVTSNDPNEPVQTIKVTGIATEKVVPETPAEEPGETAPEAGTDTGCGCRTVSSSSGRGSMGALGIASALAATLAVRSRRRSRAR
jgi:hypothetical protein